MKYKTKLPKKDFVFLFCCIMFLLANLGAIGSSGRKRAKEIVCLSNLRQWGSIFSIYMEENDGKFLSGLGSTGYYWPWQLEDKIKDWKTNKTWFCPMATTPIEDEFGHRTPTYNIFNAWGIERDSREGFSAGPNGIAGSYGLNGYALSIPPNGTFEHGMPASEGWRNFNVSGAERVPLFIDALRFDLWPQYLESPAAHEFAAWSDNHMARCCINRHNGAVNCLFMDFSARKVGLKELWTLKWHRGFRTDGPWTKADGDPPQDWPDWMRNFKDY